MKYAFVFIAVTAVFVFCSGYSFASNSDIKVETLVAKYAVKDSKAMPMPDKYSIYLDPQKSYSTRIYEYNDALIIEKKTSPFYTKSYIRVNANALTGKAKNQKWISLSKARFSRDRIYDVRKTAEGTQVIALISAFIQPSPTTWTEENLVIDTVTSKKNAGKTVVMRKVAPIRFFFTEPHRALPLPKTAGLLNKNILRLTYADGAVEHWKLLLVSSDMKKNSEKFPSEDNVIKNWSKTRSLIWWNKKGAGSGNLEDSMSWDFIENASKEPVYNKTPKKASASGAVSDVSGDPSGGFFGRLFASAFKFLARIFAA